MRFAAFAAALFFATATSAATDGFIRITVPVTPHVHLIQRPGSTNAPYEGNVEVIEQSDGLVVVDAGGSPPSGEYVVAQIKVISPKPVKYLIYTHYHGDHNLGAGAFLKAWPSVVIVSTEATRVSMTGKPMEYIKTYGDDDAAVIVYYKKQLARTDLSPTLRAGFAQIVDVADAMIAGYKNLKAYPATRTFTDTFSIPDAIMPVEVAFLGKANTDGDAIIYVPNEKVIISGDVVVSPIPYAAASFPTSWLGVLDKLKAYNAAYIIPGHGDVMTNTDYIDRIKAAIVEVQRQVVPLAKNHVALDDVYKQTDFAALRASFTHGDDWLVKEFDGFFLHSLIKNVYLETTGQPIIQGTS